MLVLNGQPILTCLDLERYFELSEVLEQAEEFAIFARGHLLFDDTRRCCLKIFEKSISMKVLGPYMDPREFWMETVPASITRKEMSLIEECFVVYNEPYGASMFSMAAAALLLAGKSAPVNIKKVNKKSIRDNQPLCFDNLKATVRSGRSYACGFYGNTVESGKRMRTIPITCKKNSHGSAVIHFFKGTEERILKIAANETVFVNIIDSEVAGILANSIETGDLSVIRINRGILVNGSLSSIPEDATSFSFRSRSEFMYIAGGKLYGVGIERLHINISGLNLYHIVEVYYDPKSRRFLFLRDDGAIFGENGSIAIQGKYTSIGYALRNEDNK